MEWILASGSPRRKELLQGTGLTFRVLPSDVSEEVSASLSPAEVVQQLAARKAMDVASKEKEACIIGADTIVVRDGEIIGKPRDQEDAARILSSLQGREHQVYSGIALSYLRYGERHLLTDYRMTKVHMRPLSEQEIGWYIKTGEPMDKAGAYGIQGKGACLIEGIEGCYFNVVGLSLVLLADMMKRCGYSLFM